MDYYQKNQQSLRKLLAKRQNPCNQVFNGQPLMSTSQPTAAINLQQRVFSSPTESYQIPQIINTSTITVILSPNSNSSNPTTAMSEEAPASEDDGRCSSEEPKLRKKFKSDVSNGSKRKSSFEEEREESTSCETHSDGTNDIPDFFFSPMMQAQREKNQRLGDFQLDDDLSHSFVLSSSEDDSFILKDAYSYAEKNEGTCCSADGLVNGKLKFKCRFNHSWTTSMDDMKRKWCPRCEQLLEDFQEFARQNGGKCTSIKFQESISFSCPKGHSWQLNHKNAKKRWCLECVKEERINMRKKCEEERAHREKEEEEYQRKLFEEARRKAMEDSSNHSSQPQQNFYSNQSTQAMMEYFQKIDYDVEKLAQKYSVEFMSRKEFTGDVSYQQILQVYKILIMPEEILQNYMGSLNSDMLKSEFRRFAKIIHPDKNKHPQAGMAFQKIYKVYEVALARFEAAPKV
jgi:thiol-disulfide isomerase/thioredoxin